MVGRSSDGGGGGSSARPAGALTSEPPPTPTPARRPGTHGLGGCVRYPRDSFIPAILPGGATHPCPGPGSHREAAAGRRAGWAPFPGGGTGRFCWRSRCAVGQEQAAGVPGRAGTGSTAVAGTGCVPNPAAPAAPGPTIPPTPPGNRPATPPSIRPRPLPLDHAPARSELRLPACPARRRQLSREIRAPLRALPGWGCASPPVAAAAAEGAPRDPPWRRPARLPPAHHSSLSYSWPSPASFALAAMSSRQPAAPGKAHPHPALPAGPGRSRRR